MQKSTFSTGGFVIHKIPYGLGKISAWYNEHGDLLDLEVFDKNGRLTGKSGKFAKNKAKRMGKVQSC